MQNQQQLCIRENCIIYWTVPAQLPAWCQSWSVFNMRSGRHSKAARTCQRRPKKKPLLNMCTPHMYTSCQVCHSIHAICQEVHTLVCLQRECHVLLLAARVEPSIPETIGRPAGGPGADHAIVLSGSRRGTSVTARTMAHNASSVGLT
jgi:hypothetical protein